MKSVGPLTGVTAGMESGLESMLSSTVVSPSVPIAARRSISEGCLEDLSPGTVEPGVVNKAVSPSVPDMPYESDGDEPPAESSGVPDDVVVPMGEGTGVPEPCVVSVAPVPSGNALLSLVHLSLYLLGSFAVVTG